MRGADEAGAALGLQHYLELGKALLVPLPPLVVQGPAAHHVAGGRLTDLALGVALRARRVRLPLVGQVPQYGQVALLAGHGGAGGDGDGGVKGAASAPVFQLTAGQGQVQGALGGWQQGQALAPRAEVPAGQRLRAGQGAPVSVTSGRPVEGQKRRRSPKVPRGCGVVSRGREEHALPGERRIGASCASAGPSPRRGEAGPAGAGPGGELEFRSQRRRVGARSLGSSSNGKTKWLLHKRK